MYQVLKIIEDKFKDSIYRIGEIKGIYLEDPNFIPKSNLPCIAINPNSTDVEQADNVRDIHEFDIDILVIMDITQKLGKPGNEVVGVEFLTEMMEARNSDGTLKENTILSIIRNNLDLGEGYKIGNISSVTYSPEVRQQHVTKEASINITVQRLLNRR